MLTIRNMNVDALKEEMKEAKVLKVRTSAAIDKQFKNKPLSSAQQIEHKKNDKLKFMYSPSETVPVKVGGIIINYKMYQRFLKKLKDFEMDLKITDQMLVLEYWKIGSKQKGSLELYDLSPYFEGFNHIPVADLERVEV